ncbi:MAG: NlpC/P60 family protein [Acetivibrionales bacterium]|jgi:cell wall-associated NlpC family hydrolase
MERPRKTNYTFVLFIMLFLLTQTTFALSAILSYDIEDGNVQGKISKEEINLSIENVKENAKEYFLSEGKTETNTLLTYQESDLAGQNITPAGDNTIFLTDEMVAASALPAETEVTQSAEPTPTPKPEIKSVVKHVNADKLNVRQEPTKESKLVTSIKRGDKVTYYETVGEWARVITWTDQKGYILAKYLVDSADKVDKVVAQAPAKAPAQEPKTEEIIVASRGTEDKSDETPPPSSETERLLDDIIAYAKTLLGVPYKWAGYSTKGIDCSGFTKYVYAKFGYNLPRSSYDYKGFGTKVSRSEIRKGDILLWDIDKNGTVGHVGIYMGDGMFIHASSSKGKVVTRSLSTYSEKYLGARRIIK